MKINMLPFVVAYIFKGCLQECAAYSHASIFVNDGKAFQFDAFIRISPPGSTHRIIIMKSKKVAAILLELIIFNIRVYILFFNKHLLTNGEGYFKHLLIGYKFYSHHFGIFSEKRAYKVR